MIDMEEIVWVKVEVRKGRYLDEVGPRWFVDPVEADGVSITMSDHRSFASAMVEALSYGLPVMDLTK